MNDILQRSTRKDLDESDKSNKTKTMTALEAIDRMKLRTSIFTRYTLDEYKKFCSVGEDRIVHRTRKKEVRFNRQIACVFGVTDGLTLEAVGEQLGGLGHATVIHSIKQCYYSMMYDLEIFSYLDTFKNNIEGHNFKFNNDYSCSMASLEQQFFNNQKQIQCN